MLLIGLLILLLAIAISSQRISVIFFNRISILILLYCVIISYNTIYINIIGSGIGVYGGLFHITAISQSFDTFIFLLASIILQLSSFKGLASLAEGGEVKPAPRRAGLEQIDNKDSSSHSNNKTVLSNNINIIYNKSLAEYPLILLFSLMGATLLISSSDLVSMYLALELQSFGLYILATLYRDSESATSAGLKYFLLGGLSSGFILLGSSLIYAFSGLTNLESICILSSITEFNNYGSLEIGILILVVGFLFKIAAAPLHQWAPDVYDGVPTIVTTWLTVMTKIPILIFLLAFPLQVNSLEGLEFQGLPQLANDSINTQTQLTISNINVCSNILIVSSILSLLIGSIVGLGQFRIKRLLAFSSISHVGFILLALAINSQQSIEAFLFYIIQYSLTSVNNFFVLLAFGYIIHNNFKNNLLLNNNWIYSPIQWISQLKAQLKPNPLLALSFAINLFSMAGIPPLIGFFAKQMVLYSAVHNGYLFISVIAIITSVISASYYLKIVKVINFESTTQNEDNYFVLPDINSNNLHKLRFLNNSNLNYEPNQLILSNNLSLTIATLTLFTLFFVIKPTLILNSVHILALSLFYW